MLPALRDHNGRPAGSVRLLAALVVLGLLGLAAPAVFPLVRWFVATLS